MNKFISQSDARNLLDNHEPLVVDVRSPQEFLSGTAPGAINIPVSILTVRANELNSEKHILVFCRSGARSEQAKMILNSLGFDKVQNVGGLGQMMNCFEPS